MQHAKIWAALCWLAIACQAFQVMPVLAADGDDQLDTGDALVESGSERVAITGTVELELSSGGGASDIRLATAELDVTADIAPALGADLVFLWEEDEGTVELDEGYITIANSEKCPFSLLGGKLVVPFGVYDTYMVQDPLSLELGEVGDTALVLNLAHDSGLEASVYGFNGDWREAGKDETIATFGAGIGYGLGTDNLAVHLRADWINNLADAEVLSEVMLEGMPAAELSDYVAGLALTFAIDLGPVSLLADYVAALDNFQPAELAFNGQGAEPAVLNVEAALGAELFGRKSTLAVGYQVTDECVALGFPESRYLTTARTEVFEAGSLALEYLHDEDYSLADQGTGTDADQVTLQLAVEF